MLNKEKIKELAFAAGADIVGIASMDRFDGFPDQMNPRFAMPDAVSMIVLGHRIMRGSLRGTEEGTFVSHYPALVEGYITLDVTPMTARRIARAIEDEGYEAMPMANHFDWAALKIPELSLRKRLAWRSDQSVPVREGLPRPDIYVDMVSAAYLAGLGEIGYSGRLLNNIYGPRLVFGCIMTELELEPDPVVAPGTICNRCMACTKECPGGCISATETETYHLGGYEITVGKKDEDACIIASVGAEKAGEGESGSYLDDYPQLKGQYKPSSISPFRRKLATMFECGERICAGKGCIRACMIGLEERKAVENTFKTPFRKRPVWSVDWAGIESGRIKLTDQPPNANRVKSKMDSRLQLDE